MIDGCMDKEAHKGKKHMVKARFEIGNCILPQKRYLETNDKTVLWVLKTPSFFRFLLFRCFFFALNAKKKLRLWARLVNVPKLIIDNFFYRHWTLEFVPPYLKNFIPYLISPQSISESDIISVSQTCSWSDHHFTSSIYFWYCVPFSG